MKKAIAIIFLGLLVCSAAFAFPECEGNDKNISKYSSEYFIKAKSWTNCQGIIIYRDGTKYAGEWKEGKFNGQGAQIWANGDKYVGQFKNDNWHGQGILTHADGRIEEGIWKNGKLVKGDEIGIQIVQEEPAQTQLVVESSLPECKGTIPSMWTNCHGTYASAKGKYVGEWKDGKIHGQGTYTFSDGDKYVGGWKKNKMHGKGTITLDGTVIKAIFKNGELVKRQ